jgi:hypothetical protein
MNKRKIGGIIVSQFNHTNYGSCLQAYATLKTVQKTGYDMTFIHYRKQRSIWEKIKIIPQYLLCGGWDNLELLIKRKWNSILHPEYPVKQQIRIDKTNLFKRTEFSPYIKVYYGYKSLQEGSKEYDVIFVGSDQVWRPIGFYSNYWNLNFVADEVPKFSYASSFGVSMIPKMQIEGTRRYLERMDLISVREQKAKEIIESITTQPVKLVADPTMLLTREEWLSFAEKSSYQLPSDNYIFCYFLGPRSEIRLEAQKLSKKTGLKIVTMRHMDEYVPADETIGDFAPFDIDAYDFVKILANAKYVCTDSFHGTVFSIILHKKFTTFYRIKPSSSISTHSRIDSLLNIFGLSSRLFCGNILSICDRIDYDKVDSIMNKFRFDSITFLKKGLSLSEKKSMISPDVR